MKLQEKAVRNVSRHEFEMYKTEMEEKSNCCWRRHNTKEHGTNEYKKVQERGARESCKSSIKDKYGSKGKRGRHVAAT